MMDERTFLQLAAEAKKNIVNGHLREALYLASVLTTTVGESHYCEACESIRANYSRLLEFMQTGNEDTSRDKVYTQLLHKAISLLQETRRRFHLQKHNDTYAIACQKFYPNEEDRVPQALELMSRNDTFSMMDDLFDLIWVSPQLSEEEVNLLVTITEMESDELQQYIASAITLSLLEYFDPLKTQLLLDYCQSSNRELRARALVGFCIASQLHGSYILLYPELCKRFEALDLDAEIAYIQHDFCVYQESERMQKKMQEEIIPNLLKAQKQREKLGFDLEELNLTGVDSGLDRNTRKSLDANMREMATLFQDGMDLNLGTFTALKGFPFFQRPGHWLAPFDANRPEACKSEVVQHMQLCDSDKYSISLLVNTMPKEQLSKMEEQLKDQMEGHGLSDNSEKSDIQVYHNVIQCLYRCLKRSPWSPNWPVVFSPQMNFIHNVVMKDRLKENREYLRETSRTLLRYKHYDDALEHLEILLHLEGGTSDLYQDLAQCQEQLGKLQSAINYYRQASLLSPSNENILFKLQSCFSQLGRYDSQLDCLLELEQMKPDDARVLTETGLCLMQLERWKEAEQRFYKMEFNNVRLVPSIRAIAWCALQEKDFDLANRYYHRIIAENPMNARWEDFLNCGHTEWLKGNIPMAINLYRQYTGKYLIAKPEAKDALMPFDQDAAVLLKLGLKKIDIDLMHDVIASML